MRRQQRGGIVRSKSAQDGAQQSVKPAQERDEQPFFEQSVNHQNNLFDDGKRKGDGNGPAPRDAQDHPHPTTASAAAPAATESDEEDE